jgi:hypothetical protein
MLHTYLQHPAVMLYTYLQPPAVMLLQSAILGMHSINQRATVMPGGKIEARPIMNLAVTYDHRLIDGREVSSAPIGCALVVIQAVLIADQFIGNITGHVEFINIDDHEVSSSRQWHSRQWHSSSGTAAVAAAQGLSSSLCSACSSASVAAVGCAC